MIDRNGTLEAHSLDDIARGGDTIAVSVVFDNLCSAAKNPQALLTLIQARCRALERSVIRHIEDVHRIEMLPRKLPDAEG